MPSRTPIIPTMLGNKIVLRALHNEMKEKNIIKEEETSTKVESAASSDCKTVSEEGEEKKKEQGTLQRKTRNSTEKMTRGLAEAETSNKAVVAAQSDSGSGGDDSDESGDSWEERSDKTEHSSSDDEREEIQRKRRENIAKRNIAEEIRRREHIFKSATLPPPQTQNGFIMKQTAMDKAELSERDKQEIREGYERFVINGERPPTGASFGARLSAFTKVNKAPHKTAREKPKENEITFPLERAAAGEVDGVGISEAKKFEKVAKQKIKIEKQAIADAKLSVTEAKMTEFEAKLRARQARIDELHAKLCKRRAVIKRAEEQIQSLESRLDEEEELQRERERKVRNRERRVKQEEAGIQIKEASLKKREAKITEDMKDIERRRKMVEEKESMTKTMEDIMKKRENLHYDRHHKGKGQSATTNGKILRKPVSKDTSSGYGTLSRRNEKTDIPHSKCNDSDTLKRKADTKADGHRSRHNDKVSFHLKSSAPIPTPRKSLENSSSRRHRSNSLDSETLLTEEDNSKSGKRPTEILTAGSLPRSKNKSAIIGLWL